MDFQSHLRAWARKNPRLKPFLIIPYTWMLCTRWWIRSRVLHSPFELVIGQHRMKLWPVGQIAQVLYNNSFELSERNFVLAYLKPGMRVVDAGANIGLYTVMASILTGQTGCVHAFEPGGLAFQRLKRNLRLNDCQNVVTYHVALSDANEEMVLRVDPQHPTFDAHCFVLPLREAVPLASTDEIVPCRKLDDYSLEGIDLIKIDVEGEELAMLQGALKTLTDSPDVTLLMECTRNREQAKNFLEEQGFLSFSWDDREQALKSVVFEQAVLTGNIVLRRRPWMPKPMSCTDRRGL